MVKSLICAAGIVLAGVATEAYAGGNCFGNQAVVVQGFGVHGVNAFAVQQPVFVNAAFANRGVFVAAPIQQQVFVRPQAVRVPSVNVQVLSGRQFRAFQQVQRRGPFGGQVIRTTIR